jgi:hypothetical protein
MPSHHNHETTSYNAPTVFTQASSHEECCPYKQENRLVNDFSIFKPDPFVKEAMGIHENEMYKSREV